MRDALYKLTPLPFFTSYRDRCCYSMVCAFVHLSLNSICLSYSYILLKTLDRIRCHWPMARDAYVALRSIVLYRGPVSLICMKRRFWGPARTASQNLQIANCDQAVPDFLSEWSLTTDALVGRYTFVNIMFQHFLKVTFGNRLK